VEGDVIGKLALDSCEQVDESAKTAHARYMRFWRSVTSATRKTPEVVLTSVSKLRMSTGGLVKSRSSLTEFFEDWMQAKEQWRAPQW
jgi:hypothetical protein